MKRLLIAVVAAALMSFSPMALSSSASAAPGTPSYTGGTAPQGGFNAEKMRRPVVFAKGQQRGNRLFIKGTVRPGYKNRQVVIQRKTCNSCAFKRFKTTKVGSNNKYLTRIAAPNRVGPRFTYRAFALASGRYFGTASRQTVITCRTTGGGC